MKKLISLLFLLFINLFNCQYAEGQYTESEIYKLKLRIEKGDKKALYELAPYFDSSKKLAEFLGYHYLETQESFLAKRAIAENTTFTNQEMNVDSISSSKQFLDFLKKNERKIKYSPNIRAFYITTINQRNESVAFRELPNAKFEKLAKKIPQILQQNWIKTNRIDILIKENKPEVLVKICESFYRKRDRFDAYNRNKEDFYDLLTFLIHKEIGSIGMNHSLSWDTDDYNFDNNAILNLLIYFSKNYKSFVWDSSSSYFINKSLKSQQTDEIANLFEDLYNENDSIALNTFIKLSQSDVKRVNELSAEKERNFLSRANYILPTFPFRFLSQLSQLTSYYKQNNIDFQGTKDLHTHIEKLSAELSFRERRKYENYLIDYLSLQDLIPLEYWSLIYEKRPGLSESVSRILDIYYTKNWNKILNDENQLTLYLKKSLLYSRVGINGNLNYYLFKFTENGNDVIKLLNKIKSNDPDITFQIEKAKKICLEHFDYPIDTKKTFDGNFNSQQVDLKTESERLRLTAKDNDDFEREILKLFSKIGYSQIPEAFQVLENLNFNEKNYRNKYSLFERDFGFFMIKDWKDKTVRDEFLSVYKSHTEKELYRYYLDLAGIDYKNQNGNIDYDKVYEILKFNIVTPFTGSSELENEVGAVIKLLELDQKTALGYPDKLCNSAGMYICPPSDRAWEWRKYLKEKKLLKEEHSKIVSFNYGYYVDKVLMYRRINEGQNQ
ncbi:hypothetical protein BA768_12610 [Chryseobacterium sp. CBo1]|uniref:hypothetical protein n=1 Tax=Chryseobacterium sp. CBo1 TaxID=1869230 RepID=UPI00081081AB|nr:hypothetical protein [Chryseobacterium sp. CBo1]OCK52426.1 hypothetical protein BA768_12610 [Chryseobacterium sp. CBo1]